MDDQNDVVGSHKVRSTIVGLFENGHDELTTPEIAKLLDQPLAVIAYHVRVLAGKAEVLVQTGERVVGGTLHKLYGLGSEVAS